MHHVGIQRYSKNTYGVDCRDCSWSVTITTKNAFATTEAHARAWGQAHQDGKPRPDRYQDPRKGS